MAAHIINIIPVMEIEFLVQVVPGWASFVLALAIAISEIIKKNLSDEEILNKTTKHC